MNKELPNESALIAELKATYPGLHVRPLREFSRLVDCKIGVWTGGPGDMPDGLPIFNNLAYGTDAEWDGHVHKGFTAWLAARGWSVDTYDSETFLIIPTSELEFSLEQVEAMRLANAEWSKRPALADGESPF